MEYIYVIIFCLFLFAFPGIFTIRFVVNFNIFSKLIITVYVSIGFWICITWFISWFKLPLNYSVLFLQLLFTISFGFSIRKKIGNYFRKILSIKIRKIPIQYVLLLIAILIELYPLCFITIPPGCDSAMHGYITRLIINNNGLPQSYRPILPVDYFGSYSAGYHVLTALASGLKLNLLRYAINFISIIVYPLTLLGLIFLLKNFFTEKIAMITGLVFFGINHSYISTIWWGGNPSILSFAFCLFCAGLFINAVRSKHRYLFYLTSICFASILLIHAIPAIIFFYIFLLMYIMLLIENRIIYKWIIFNSFFLFVIIGLLLFPFIIHFKNDNSVELILRIKQWQKEMMSNKLNGKVVDDIFATLNQIKYRIGDVLTITTGISFVGILYYKKAKEILVIGLFILLIFVIIFNSGYWFLPLSELLYPERVMFYMIVVWAMVFGYFIAELYIKKPYIKIYKWHLYIYVIVLIPALVLSGDSLINQSLGLAKDKRINCNKATMAAFDWVNKNTDTNALFYCSYADAGMWLPTFTNRATIGTHIHFIHEVKNVNCILEASKAARYYFITKNDKSLKREILNKTTNKLKVFSNEEVQIFK